MYLWIVWLVVHDLVRVSCKLGLIFAIDWHDAIYFCAAMLRTFDSVCSWMGPMMNGLMLIAYCRCSARIDNFLHSLILWFISYISWDCTGTIIIALSQLLCLFEMRWGKRLVLLIYITSNFLRNDARCILRSIDRTLVLHCDCFLMCCCTLTCVDLRLLACSSVASSSCCILSLRGLCQCWWRAICDGHTTVQVTLKVADVTLLCTQ